MHSKRRHCLRLIADALRYICRTGCQWRCQPSSFAPWSAVYYYFRRWQRNGCWQALTDAVNCSTPQSLDSLWQLS